MIWIEMSREPDLRPDNYRVGDCLSSPKYKDNGATWGYWETMKQVEKGDTIIHLCGKANDASFIGYSEAESNVFEVENDLENNPRDSYRITLINFIEFDKPINLYSIFKQQNNELRNYFANNKQHINNKKERLFYVIQNNELRCQNGAYLSEVTSSLANIIFGKDFSQQNNDTKIIDISTKTSTQLRKIKVRVGHSDFSKNVKNNFNNICAFPECNVNEKSFLIGAHIARWADNIDLRGNTSNGLCLCLFHDKAFENGFFTLDKNMNIIVNKMKTKKHKFLSQMIDDFNLKKIKEFQISPSPQSLEEHWKRIKFTP